MLKYTLLASGVLAALVAAVAAVADAADAAPPRHDVGRPATASDVRKHGFLVGPTGEGLPRGSGSAIEGRTIYLERCASCHGARGEGMPHFPPLVGGQGSLAGPKPVATVGSFWPYATTVWDYINRAMPYQAAGTLRPDDVYAVTAYVLAMNGIVREDARLDEKTLPQVRMPNRDGFVSDPRPDVK